ncbi:MAG: hypothetical protein SFW67_33540, partial [Myxococcaceae bacterium]|nr:hypothetical protein [Myxococcaceae bacterium]
MRHLFVATAAVFVFACGTPPPTFHQDVRPILEGRCVNCHVTGGVGPFALDGYAAAKAMGPAMVDSTQKGRMPPWLATGNDTGGFLRDPSLTAEQKDVL